MAFEESKRDFTRRLIEQQHFARYMKDKFKSISIVDYLDYSV